MSVPQAAGARGPADDNVEFLTKPSFFEVYLQDNITQALQPAFKYCCKVLLY